MITLQWSDITNTLKAELINQYYFRTEKELDYAVQKFAYF